MPSASTPPARCFHLTLTEKKGTRREGSSPEAAGEGGQGAVRVGGAEELQSGGGRWRTLLRAAWSTGAKGQQEEGSKRSPQQQQELTGARRMEGELRLCKH